MVVMDEFGEFMDCEVGALAGAVDREEPEHGDIHLIEVVIDVAECFAGEF